MCFGSRSGCSTRPRCRAATRARRLRGLLIGLAGLAALTMASGGFVAGLNAGFIYNTFPLMDGRLIPEGYGARAPLILNLFETVEAVQFNHRLLATATLGVTLALWLWSLRLELAPGARRALDLACAMAWAQFGLGVAALILVVPVWLGALHQAGALLLFSLVLWAIHRLRPASHAPRA